MRVFITGASSGIGRELCKHLVAAGHEVWGIARREDALEQLASELDSSAFRFTRCDLADIQACSMLRAAMSDEHYVPDIVVLNAAIDVEDGPSGLNVTQSQAMMRINYDGAHYWVSAFVEDFKDRGHGQFIGIASIFAHWPDPASVTYAASKAALAMLFRGLRIRYADSGMDFKLLYLGPVDTPINPRFSEQEPAESFIVASAESTAAYIGKMIGSGRQDFYFPFYILVIFVLLRWLPDKLFQLITNPFKR